MTNSKKTNRKLVVIAAALTAALAGVLIAIFLLTPKSIGDQLAAARGSVVLENSKSTEFKSDLKAQRSLTVDGEHSSQLASFVYGNGRDKNAPMLDFFYDLGEPYGRDSFISQSALLKSAIESGAVSVRVNLIVGGSAYSALAANAFAVYSASNPDKSWDMLRELTRQASFDAAADSEEAIAENIHESIMRSDENSNVSVSDILAGDYIKWLLTVHENESLTDGVTIPVVQLDGVKLSVDDDNYNDAEAFRKSLMAKLDLR